MWRIFGSCWREAGQRGLRADAAWPATTTSNTGSPSSPSSPSSLASPGERDHEHEQPGGHSNGRFCHQNTRTSTASAWYGAISWSGAIAMGWYVSQMACLSWRKRKWMEQAAPAPPPLHLYACPLWQKVNILKDNFLPAKVYTQPETLHDIVTARAIREAKQEESGLKNISIEVDSKLKCEPEPALEKPSEPTDFADVLNIIENKLGIMAIENGDYKRGIGMLHSAAQRDFGPAQYNLALCYEKGLGMKKNEKTALELYIAAASKNHPGALYNLAVFYGQGRGGLNKDTDTAERFLHLAAENGQQDAVDALEKIVKRNEEHKTEFQKPPNLCCEEINTPSPTDVFLNLINSNNNNGTNYVSPIYT